jgi:tetratricopeptide (TPR) repeat protein
MVPRGVPGGRELRVFLSHTSELRELPPGRSYVAAAEAAVIRAGHRVSDMAYFTARDVAPADDCAARVREAHVYVGIVGLRYGLPVRELPDLSYTEFEFETATASRLPRLIFLVQNDALPRPAEGAELAARQDRFRNRLLETAGVISWVGSPAELELKLYQALVELGPRLEAVAAPKRTLPRDVKSFTGREEELERLFAAVSEGAPSGAVRIIAIEGMAGVGKSALAIHAGHRLSAWFPDGQVFLELHAHTAGQAPVTSANALRNLLLMVDVPMQLIPEDLDARAAMWRDQLAGRSMLIVLDDASDHQQVRPLLPGAPGCLVLITSRRRLAGLGDIQPLALDTLPPARAAQLFNRLVDTRSGAADPSAVAELMRLCGYLPLAISLMAGRLWSHPSWQVGHLLATLERTRDRLAEMQVENLAIEAAFEQSYRELDPDLQRLFRRLGLHAGREIDAHAAAALDSTDLATGRRRLEALYNHHLVEEPVPGRYQLHDLIRDYARALASRDDAPGNEAAIERVLDYYAHATWWANRHIAVVSYPDVLPLPRPSAGVPDISSGEDALAWLEAERANLTAYLDYAATHDRPIHVGHLANALHSFLRVMGYWDEAVTVHQMALDVARHSGDRGGQANALVDLGIVQRLMGEYTSATASVAEALSVYHEAGDRLGQANALNAGGAVRYLTGESRAAVGALTEALHLYGELGDELGQATALTNLGIAYTQLREYAAASRSLTEALRQLADLHSQFARLNALRALGVVQHMTGDHATAFASLTEALRLNSDLRLRSGEAETHNSLGALLLDSSSHEEALPHHQSALQIARDIRNPLEEARALEGIGRCLDRAGDAHAAIATLRVALAICQRLGAPDAERIEGTLAGLQSRV